MSLSISDDDDRSVALHDEDDDDYRPSDQDLLVSRPVLPVHGDPNALVADDDHPSHQQQQPKKRGRKPHPNPAVRSAREAARRANHSVIEKRRREKINSALAELRSLVPYDLPLPNDEPLDADEQQALGTNGGKIPPKEYKLEVLVRTLAYVKHLISRVDSLERSPAPATTSPANAGSVAAPAPSAASLKANSSCPNCSGPRFGVPTSTSNGSSSARSDHHSASTSSRLPSLASLLNPAPHSGSKPVSVLAAAGHYNHLPSPPASGSLHAVSPIMSTSLPAFHLPSSTLPLRSPSTTSPGTLLSRPRRNSVEDEAAASLLLDISRSRANTISSNSSSSGTSHLGTLSLHSTTAVEGKSDPSSNFVSTPSSILDMGERKSRIPDHHRNMEAEEHPRKRARLE